MANEEYLVVDGQDVEIDKFFIKTFPGQPNLSPGTHKLKSKEAKNYYSAMKSVLYWRTHPEITIASELEKLKKAIPRPPQLLNQASFLAVREMVIFFEELKKVNKGLAEELRELLDSDAYWGDVGGLFTVFLYYGREDSSQLATQERQEWNAYMSNLYFRVSAFKSQFEEARRQHKSSVSTGCLSDLFHFNPKEMLILAEQRLEIARTDYCANCAVICNLNINDLPNQDVFTQRRIFQNSDNAKAVFDHIVANLDNLTRFPADTLKEGFRYNPKADLHLYHLWNKLGHATNLGKDPRIAHKDILKYALIEALDEERLLNFLKTLNANEQHQELALSVEALGRVASNQRGASEILRLLKIELESLPETTSRSKKGSDKTARLIELAYRTIIAVKTPANSANLLRYAAAAKEIAQQSWGQALVSYVQRFVDWIFRTHTSMHWKNNREIRANAYNLFKGHQKVTVGETIACIEHDQQINRL